MVCRLCFCESEEYVEIFSEEMIPKHIKKFLDLEISEHDPVSDVVCTVCLQHLKDFTIFYFRIKEAQQNVQIKLKKEITIEEEEPFEYVDTDPDFTNPDQSQEIHIEEEEILEQNLPDFSDDKSTSTTITSSKNDPDYPKVSRKRRQAAKSDEDKKALAKLMQQEELIWNRQHNLRCNSAALTQAWTRIAAAMPGTKTVSECKGIWRSMRDAIRYKRKQKLGVKVKIRKNDKDDFRSMLNYLSNCPNRRRKPDAVVSNNDTKSIVFDSPNQQPAEATESIENNSTSFTETNNFPSVNTTFGQPYNDLSHRKDTLTIGETNITTIKKTEVTSPYHIPSSSSSYFHKNVKDEVSDLVGSISKALNRLVTIATTELQQVKSLQFEFKYEYIWRLVESLYVQMDTSTINDVNQQIINLVYSRCRVTHY